MRLKTNEVDEKPKLIETLKVSDYVNEDMSQSERERVERDIERQNQLIEVVNNQTLSNFEHTKQIAVQREAEEKAYTKRVDAVFDAVLGLSLVCLFLTRATPRPLAPSPSLEAAL